MLENFFKYIDEKEVKKNGNFYKIKIKGDSLGGQAMNDLAMSAKYIIYHEINEKIRIEIEAKIISDLATIVVFEYIIYLLLKYSNCSVYIRFRPSILKYTQSFIDGSIVGDFINSNQSFILKRKDYIHNFESEAPYTNLHRYRKLIKNDKDVNKKINKVSTDAYNFLQNQLNDEAYIEDCVEVIGELCSNATEHTKEDCILTIECGYGLNEKEQKKNILSIVVSNVSENLFYQNILHANEQGKIKVEYLDKAKQNHGHHFGEIVSDEYSIRYDEEYFYMVSAFQKGVSSRLDQSDTGGTGLLKIIYNILGKTDDNFCYILTSNKVLFLIEEFIQPKDKTFIGFNEENDYLSAIPAKKSLGKSYMSFGGTIFSLNLISDKEKNDE
ncbi:hypothetical protein [uncultured Holdemanella sp.]|uniref:hypothetical protein n=1 Tax=uncultured Holdemanella sp. TaxID=1763549 RepID=UPI00258E9C55|nr:hypothetical protein [uncultured Holdemanella sp.]